MTTNQWPNLCVRIDGDTALPGEYHVEWTHQHPPAIGAHYELADGRMAKVVRHENVPCSWAGHKNCRHTFTVAWVKVLSGKANPDHAVRSAWPQSPANMGAA